MFVYNSDRTRVLFFRTDTSLVSYLTYSSLWSFILKFSFFNLIILISIVSNYRLTKGPAKYDNRGFNFRDEDLRSKFGIGTPRMGGFGIRDVPFNDRNFSDGEFNERTFTEKNFSDKNFSDTNFNERKEKLSTSSFHKERENRESNLVSRNSFNGFPRIGARDGHFQLMPDGRNKRVSEFECDI